MDPDSTSLRVFNFGTGCNFGDFKALFMSIPGTGLDPGALASILFEEEITFEVTLEGDDDFNLNLFPFADYVLRGEDP